MEAASSRLKRYSGIGGRGYFPSLSTPVLRNLTACWSVHPSSPAIGGAVAAHGISTAGENMMGAPCSDFSGMYSPFSFRGEWQSIHIPTWLTRYLPRSIFELGAFCASSVPERETTAQSTNAQFFIDSPHIE